MTLEGEGQISNPYLELDNYNKVTIPLSLKSGETLTIDMDENATITNSKGDVVKTISLKGKIPTIYKGNHTLMFNCNFDEGTPVIQMRLKLNGKEESISK